MNFRRNSHVLTLTIIALFLFSFVYCSEKEDLTKGGIMPPPPVTNNYQYPKTNKQTIRLLTYNAFYCKSNTPNPAFNETNTKHFADVIRSLDADIVAIQELDSGVTTRSKRFLLKQIRDYTGIDYQYIFGNAASYGGGGIGDGVLVKKEIPILKVEKVPLPGEESRMLTITELPNFVILSSHLDLNDNYRKTDAEIIVQYAQKYKKPIFLMGDLNDSPEWSGGGMAFPVLKNFFNIQSASDGSLVDQPGTTIDYILLGKNNPDPIIKQQSYIVRQLNIDNQIKTLNTYSDHYPVFLDIEFKP